MDPAYARAYRDLYSRHWWFRARRRLLLRVIAHEAPPGGFGEVLDVGCGDGLFFPDLRRWGRPSGVEPEAAVVTDEGRRLGAIHTVPFDERFEPGVRYGLIVMLDVLEHLDDDVAALRHAAALLAPGGCLVATVPAFRALWTRHDDLNHHRRRYRRAELLAAATAAGLSPRRPPRYAFGWLAAVKLLVRLRETVHAGPDRLPGVPPRPLDRLCYAACVVEQTLARFLPLPVGSSLLLVAERDPAAAAQPASSS